MFIAALLFFLILVMTIFAGRKGEAPEIPVTATAQPAATRGWELRLDQFRWILVLALILIAIAYVPFFVQYWPPKLVVPGFRLY